MGLDWASAPPAPLSVTSVLSGCTTYFKKKISGTPTKNIVTVISFFSSQKIMTAPLLQNHVICIQIIANSK